MSGITDVALRAAIAKLPSGNAVRDATVEGLQSTIVLAGEQHEIAETMRRLASALSAPSDTRIRGELQRAKSRLQARQHGPRELHLAKRYGSHGPGMADLPQFGPYKATPEDVASWARRAFVDANVALLMLGDEPWKLSFALPAGDRPPSPDAAALDGLNLPAREHGPYRGVSASFEMPDTAAGRLAFTLLSDRLDARGTPADLSGAVERVGGRECIALLGSGVADAFVREAAVAIVQETKALAQTPPEDEELRRAGASLLAQISATPYTLGRHVIGEALLGTRLQSRAELVDTLWDVEPAAVSLAAELMARTMLVLLPRGVEIDELEFLDRETGEPDGPVKGKRHRPIGMAIDWAAHARGFLFVGDEGVSQVTRQPVTHTIRFDDVELVIDHDDGGGERGRGQPEGGGRGGRGARAWGGRATASPIRRSPSSSRCAAAARSRPTASPRARPPGAAALAPRSSRSSITRCRGPPSPACAAPDSRSIAVPCGAAARIDGWMQRPLPGLSPRASPRAGRRGRSSSFRRWPRAPTRRDVRSRSPTARCARRFSATATGSCTARPSGA